MLAQLKKLVFSLLQSCLLLAAKFHLRYFHRHCLKPYVLMSIIKIKRNQPQYSVKCHFSNLFSFARQYLCCQQLMNSLMTKTAYLSFRRSCATEKSQKTINRDPSALRFVGMTKTLVTRLKLVYLIIRQKTKRTKDRVQ